MRTFVCGDVHGKIDIKKLSTEFWPEQRELTKEDVLIQLGDFGWIWHPLAQNNPEQNYWLNWLGTRKYTLLVVLGNHENYDEIEQLPECQKFNGTVQYLEVSGRHGDGIIYFAKRGEVYEINNKKFWAFGGALSIDKDNRTPGVSWWEGELPTWWDYEYGMKQLDKINWNVDYVVSHTCPVNIVNEIIHKTPYTEGKFKDPVAVYFFEIYKKLLFKEWHFGHFHEDIRLDYTNTGDGIFHVHYNNKPFELI
jgi:hypothetical protein